MRQTNFKITQMDCPSEENLIRMKLQDLDNVLGLDFDLTDRTLIVTHKGDYQLINDKLSSLKLGSQFIESKSIESYEAVDDSKQRKVLWAVLAINFAFFIIEMSIGIISKSMGLVADSLDMLADSFVYGLSLFAVGAAIARKKKVALISGYFQITLAVIGFVEVVRRFVGIEQMPDFKAMIGISALALIANTISLVLLQRTKSKDAHMQASIIFSSNDIIINAGVIVAGLLVWALGNGMPDLIIGTIVFFIVIRGAIRILKLAK